MEDKLVERGDDPAERFNLDLVKNEILEKVKVKKTGRHGRRDSISSMGSVSSQKRISSDPVGGDSARLKSETSYHLPIPLKTQQ